MDEEVKPPYEEGDDSPSPSVPVQACWSPRQLVFHPYLPPQGSNRRARALRVVARRPLVARLTKGIVETYQTCNSEFNYAEDLIPKRFLTSPAEGVLNDGHDNANSDLILYVDYVLVNSQRHLRYIVKDALGHGTFGQVVRCWVPETNSFVALKIIKNHPAYYQQAIVEVSILTTIPNSSSFRSMNALRINLFIQTFLLLFSKRPVPDRAMNIIGIAVFWTWFPLLVLRLPNFMEMALFVLVSFTVTAFQHVQFTLNHFSADVYVGKPVGNDWFQKQTEGSIDITCPSWMDWAFGGLQFQLEHRLFPRLPRCHLRKISPVVQEYCKKHALPYRSLSWFAENVRTIQTLRTAALQARDLTKGAPKNLLWEAINIHAFSHHSYLSVSYSFCNHFIDHECYKG